MADVHKQITRDVIEQSQDVNVCIVSSGMCKWAYCP